MEAMYSVGMGKAAEASLSGTLQPQLVKSEMDADVQLSFFLYFIQAIPQPREGGLTPLR